MPLNIHHIREGKALTRTQQLRLTVTLALPAMLAQLSSILMQYIDAAMVGHLGADASASIGLVSTSLWLFWGTCSMATTGFSVQVAHRIGANDEEGARRILRQGLTASLLFGVLMAVVGLAIAGPLPHWLGGEEQICSQASLYFAVFVAALPLLIINYLAGAMLRCVGNMKVPSIISVAMCVLDCLFNYLFIFVCNLGVLGAALGTVAAEILSAGLMLGYCWYRQPELRIKGRPGSFRMQREVIRRAGKIALPMTAEHAIICGAQIAVTVIVAPLGVLAIAANSFAVTAESLCYMPGYGIGDAATVLTGQSYGAGRKKLVKSFGFITVGLGMTVMSLMGVLMWFAAPELMAIMTPVEGIRELGVSALRIEAWAEPMFAASIVAYGAMVGVGKTTAPAVMNFGSIWLVRLPLAWLLSRTYGLDGVWMAMAIELTFRGLIFLIRLFRPHSWIPLISG
ncbi:MAG: MATE family efflux transporter [Bacteroides sp.]|nr:MATE family efflux transporter [Bacteroides sp.]MCM1378951.1 MATE family efflux transporter [Bacteroides sp.]MCM1445567.1 MATE family efflux transporter [Prevotella sp.]